MCKQGCKTARASSKPEWIVYWYFLHILALLKFWCAHLLCEDRHDGKEVCRSCIGQLQELRPSRRVEYVEIKKWKKTTGAWLSDRDFLTADVIFGYTHGAALGIRVHLTGMKYL